MANINRENNQNREDKFDILSTPHLRENPFEAPQGYFAQFEKDIQERIKASSSEIEKSNVNSKGIFSPQLKTVFSMAAMFIIILGFGYSVMYVTNTLSSTTSQQVATTDEVYNFEEVLSDEEISLYLGSNFSYSQEDVEKTDNIEIVNLDKDILEDYIIDNYRSSTSILAALE